MKHHGKEKDAESQEITVSRQEYEDLTKRLTELEALRERLMLSAADFENAKKRLTRERDEFVKFSQENILKEILPVVDNFERALAHAGEANEKNLKGIVSGVEMVLKQLSEILKNQGLKRIKTVGEKYDPHMHEAVGFVHEKGPEDIIVEELQSGYILHDRLLRAAKVRVRMPPQEEKQEEIT